MTESEIILWAYLRRKQIEGLQFYRQKPVGNYIVDFYCPAAKLIIELDGSQHLTKAGMRKDSARDSYLEGLGFQVLRIPSWEVFGNLEGAMQLIVEEIQEKLKSLAVKSRSLP